MIISLCNVSVVLILKTECGGAVLSGGNLTVRKEGKKGLLYGLEQPFHVH